MTRSHIRSHAAVLFVVASSACFDPSVPNDAVILCRSDRECAPPSTCDLASHLCAKPGEAAPHAPHLVDATFTPSAVRDGVEVQLAIDADVALSATAPPVLTFADPGAPAFHAGAPSATPTHVVMSATVDGSIAEGFYVLDSIALTSDAALSATTPVDGASFKVDRTPPAISNLEVHAGDGGSVVSDQADSDAVNVTFAVDEPVDAAGLTCLVGTAPLACTIGAGLAVSCAGTIPSGGAGVVDGENVVLVTAVDAAGNQSQASAQLAVDLSPPSIVPGSVVIDVDGSPNAQFATVGSSIDLQLLFDETLAADPIVTLTSGEVFTVVDHVGAFYRLHGAVAAVGVAGVVGVTAASTDRFGHAGSESVPLPSPYANGIPVQPVPTSPCTIPPNASGSTCTDFDGDGFFGPSPGCSPNPVDCDDRDPLTYPGAPELPGDGERNDCGAGTDAPLAAGLHVDAVNGSDGTGDGSAARPFKTLGEAIAVAANIGAGAPLLLAPGSYPVVEQQMPLGLIGGLDPVTWQRGAGESRVFVSTAGNDCTSTISVVGDVIDGVTFAESLETSASPASLVDVVVDGCGVTVDGAAVLLRVHGDGAGLTINAPGVAVISSTFAGAQVHAAGALFLRSTIGSELFVDGAVNVVDSVVVADPGAPDDPAILCASCSAVGVYYSNVLGLVGTGVVGVTGAQNTDVRIISSQLQASSNDALVTLNNGSLLMFDDVIDQPGGFLAITATATVTNDAAGLAQLNACSFGGCLAAGGNFFGAISTQGDELHEGNAPAGVNYGDDTFHLGSPTSIAGDVDGQCRFADGQDDVGPDEL